MDYFAHIDEEKQTQGMLEHLQGTAKIAAQFAEAFSVGEQGYFCGMLHDIGKYSDAFQRRIRGSGERVDHSTAGAKVATEEYRNVAAAFCIAGHHSGLPDGGNKKIDTPDSPTFCGKLSRKVGRDIEDFSAFRSELTVSAAEAIPQKFLTDAQSQTFFIRMLYSCLVDADYLDTEAFMTKGQVNRGNEIPLSKLEEKLAQYISPWWKTKNDLNQKRCEILKTCMEAGGGERGLFTLTVPTGGGKTVSSMAFALRHAQKNKIRRVIYVIPYTSIIEQTQMVFERIFGKEHVVAHYANLEYPTDENLSLAQEKNYLATENWDAPIILTTSVQFFESLYANRSTRCRKLHNIANSVIIFDEAQMLPVPYLKPCIGAIAQLVQNYGCSAVLCTATQPALNRLFEKQLPNEPREICSEVSNLHTFFQRVTYRKVGRLSDEELAERLRDERQVLCIVNSRKQAQSIYEMLDGEGSYHLSTTMYPAHRRSVLNEIRERLDKKLPCRVVSTSLVEAGVDVDFPAVYRALSGLDSMIQAGGRCNREGKREKSESVVSLFETDQKPPRLLEQNISAAEHVMRSVEDISSPEAVTKYFEFLYYTLKDEKELDQKQILADIDSQFLPFASVAEKFHIIEGAECIVYIPLEEGEQLVRQLKEYGPSRHVIRKLGQYAVSVYSKHFYDLLQLGAIEKLGEATAVLSDLKLYRNKTGLLFHASEGQGFLV